MSEDLYSLVFKGKIDNDQKIKYELFDTLDIAFQHVSEFCINEPRCEKTGLRGFRPGPTQTRLYSHRRWLDA